MVDAVLECRPRADGVGFGLASRWDADAACTSPEEYRMAARLPPGRRSDFLLGRRALHRALAAAGLGTGGAIGFSGRRPRLPAGAVGSISHSAGIGVALAARRTRFQSVGIDIEFSTLAPAAGRLILTDPERAWVHRGSEETARRRLLIAFSAKEAAFKALDLCMSNGAPRLRAIALQPYGDGFIASAEDLPGKSIHVHVRPMAEGVLAWTVFPAGVLDPRPRRVT
jgi:enterobactin synthetase component D